MQLLSKIIMIETVYSVVNDISYSECIGINTDIIVDINKKLETITRKTYIS